jgi:hypothetical protein
MFQRVTAKYNGRYFDFPLTGMDLDPEQPVDADILTALAQRIAVDVAAEKDEDPADHLPNFAGFVVDPPQDERLAGQHAAIEVLSVRPPAPYGCCVQD